MRKFLALTVGLSLVAIMTFGAIGSAAWFTSSDTVAVTATSGKITVTGSPTFTLSNLMPGVWTDPVQFKIYNHNTPDSTVPVKFRVTEQLLDQTIDGFHAQILVQATGRYCDGAELGSPVYQGLLMDLTFDNSSTPTLWTAGLPINITACYDLSFKLLNATPNTFQNQTAHFNLVIDATQLENPGWTE